MLGSVGLICTSLIIFTVLPSSRCQSDRVNDGISQERPVIPQITEAIPTVPASRTSLLRGLCRDGWSTGTMKDFLGKEIPICIKVNPEALTWSEAQATCRRDSGFLLKLDSDATVDKVDILSSVAAQGITRFWTGMNTENGHFVWDDLIPNQVRPHNSINGTNELGRPWSWEESLSENQQQYCGQLNIDVDDDRKRRRKRSSDDDTNDNTFPGFDFANFRTQMMNNNLATVRKRPPMPSTIAGNRPLPLTGVGNRPLPRTSAFQSILSRTQMSDQLADLPRSLGIKSAHQIPGSGIHDANIQNGGLATHMPMTASTQHFDTDSDTHSVDSGHGESHNSDSSDHSGSHPSDLLSSVREAAAAAGSIPDGFHDAPTPTEAVEALRNLFKETAENLNSNNKDSPSDLSDLLKSVDEGKVDVTIPPNILKEPDGFSRFGKDIVVTTVATPHGDTEREKSDDKPDFSKTVSSINENLAQTLNNLGELNSAIKDDKSDDEVKVESDKKDDASEIKSLDKPNTFHQLNGSTIVDLPILNIVDNLNKVNDDKQIPELTLGGTDDSSDILGEINEKLKELKTEGKSFGDLSLPDSIKNDQVESKENQDNLKNQSTNDDQKDDINEDQKANIVDDRSDVIEKLEKLLDNDTSPQKLPEDKKIEDDDSDLKPKETDSEMVNKDLDDVSDIKKQTTESSDVDKEKHDLFDDMSERLGKSTDSTKSENKTKEKDDEDDSSNSKPDSSDDLLHNSVTDSTTSDLLDKETESVDFAENASNTDDIHSDDVTDLLDKDIESSDLAENVNVDNHTKPGNSDITTKRDSDWSELDHSDSDNDTPETVTRSFVFGASTHSHPVIPEKDTDDFEFEIRSRVPLTEVGEFEFLDHLDNDHNDLIDDVHDISDNNVLLDKTEIETEDYDTVALGQQVVKLSDASDDIEDNYVDTADKPHDIDDHFDDIKEKDKNKTKEIDSQDSLHDEIEEPDSIDDTLDLAEDVIESESKTAIAPLITKKEMKLSSCEVKLPSVCFSYQVEIMDKASTCENGWYGHVLFDKCYRIVDQRLGYMAAVTECQKQNASLVVTGSKFERNFILIAIQKEGKLFRGAKFWLESPTDKKDCRFFDERGVQTMPSCNEALNVVCVKDAHTLSLQTLNNMPYNVGYTMSFYGQTGENKMFISRQEDNALQCGLLSTASEFPVLWFKDGVLVETKDKYISSDVSLYLNPGLVSAIKTVTDRDMATPALQGQYWCEVWDRQTLTRKKSTPYNVRFSDVISFYGSMEVPPFSHQNEVLFNMMDRKFPELSSAETDIKKLFKDTLPLIQTRLPFVSDVFTYMDAVRPGTNVVEYHTYYTLNQEYTVQDEEALYNRLVSIMRAQLGNRNSVVELPGQTPLAQLRTMSLRSTVACQAKTLQTTRDIYGHTIPAKIFSFPKALLGEFANSLDNCSVTNSLPSGTARCLGDFYTGAQWGEVVANDCVEETELDRLNKEIWGHSAYTDKLTQIAQTTVDVKNVEKLVSEVAQITKAAPKLTPTDINKIADVLDHSTQVKNLPRQVGEDVLKTVDRLMTVSDKETHVANVETKAANRIIKSLERYAENADLGVNDQMRFVSDNVVVEIWTLKPTTHPVIGLAAESRDRSVDTPFRTENIATVYNKSHLYDANVDAAIELPTEVFNVKEKGNPISNRLTMMVFRKSKLFEAAITEGGQRMNPTTQQLSNLNSYVISASIAGKKIEHLTEKVKTIFKPIQDSDGERNCVWWDFDMNDFKGGWSNKGCVYDGRVNGRDVCLCDHLTNFAVLIDFYGQTKPIPDHHELSLSIITVLGLSCSILGLSLTIISYVFFRKLRQGRAQQTLFNLSLSLLLSMLVFLVGVKQTHNYYGCVVVAVLLHYLILVSFMWMLMEAILQYLTFVKILGTYITRFTLKTVLPAWGLPLVPVLIVLSIDYNMYKGGPNYCWMGLDAFYYAFAVPVTCIIVINVIIFVVTVVSIFRRGKGLRSNQKKHKMAVTNLQAAITSFVLLGLTWVFGYLAISDARIPFQYVFTILNSMQGFFIFLLFVVRKKKVREQWYFICCKGIEKDRVSRSLSATNSIPSSTYSNGSRKGGRERDRSDSTKTVQSTYSIASNSSNGYTNYGYDHGYDYPFSRYDRRAFRKF